MGAGGLRECIDFDQMRASHDQDAIDTTGLERGDHMFDHGSAVDRQRELRPTHALAVPGRGDDGEVHPTASRWRDDTAVVPRLRQAINSATMLTAISGID